MGLVYSSNRWSNADKLAHLTAALTGDAGQVFWDIDDTEIDTVDKLSTLLRNRYGGTRQTDKYRMELRLRRRRHGESLSNLYQDIHRLMALAHPSLPHEARETIACDYYIDALGDADLALKVRERVPASLDDLFAFRYSWKPGGRILSATVRTALVLRNRRYAALVKLLGQMINR